jgi:hypothetical protein
MRGKNFVKYCSIVGIALALIYTPFVVLGPRIGGESRMLFPKSAIPADAPTEAAKPQTLASKITTVFVASVFLGPFGGLAGLGVGLLLHGLALKIAPLRKEDAAKS